MKPEDLQHTAAILKSICQSHERLYTYLKLSKGESPKHIAQDLDLTRSALQFYIDDWKEHELIYTEGNDYIYTDTGEFFVAEILVILGFVESSEDVEDRGEVVIGNSEENQNDLGSETDIPLNISQPAHDLKKEERLTAYFKEEKQTKYIFSTPAEEVDIVLSKVKHPIIKEDQRFEPGDKLPVIVSEFINDDYVEGKPDIERINESSEEFGEILSKLSI